MRGFLGNKVLFKVPFLTRQKPNGFMSHQWAYTPTKNTGTISNGNIHVFFDGLGVLVIEDVVGVA